MLSEDTLDDAGSNIFQFKIFYNIQMNHAYLLLNFLPVNTEILPVPKTDYTHLNDRWTGD